MFIRCLALALCLPTAVFAQADFFGASVASLGDLDGDGVAEFAVGAPGDDADGRAFVFSGTDYATLFALASPEPTEQCEGCPYFYDTFGGGALTDASDLNGDGVPDIYIGDPTGGDLYDDNYRPRFHNGRAFAFDGATGEVIYRLAQPSQGALVYAKYGAGILRLGDITDDGIDDIVVSAWGSGTGNSYRGAGQTIVIDGVTGDRIRTDFSWRSGMGGHFGRTIIPLDDMDGDGVAEYYANSYDHDHQINSGATGNRLLELSAGLPTSSSFSRLRRTAVPDQDGDGYTDLSMLGPDGILYVYSSATLGLIREVSLPGANAQTQTYKLVSSADRVAANIKNDPAGPQVLYVLSATTDALHVTIPPPSDIVGYDFGSDIAFLPDTSGDGIEDILVGATHPNEGGLAFIFSGADGSELRRLDASGLIVADEAVPSARAVAVRVGPNPVRGRTAVTLTLPQAAVARVSVFDVLGREVAVLADGAQRAGDTSVDLDASGWAPGVYLVRLATADGVRTTRLTVAR